MSSRLLGVPSAGPGPLATCAPGATVQCQAALQGHVAMPLLLRHVIQDKPGSGHVQVILALRFHKHILKTDS